MTEKTQTAATVVPADTQAKKIFLNSANGLPPAPIFMNFADVAGIGADITMDLGFVSVEAALASSTSKPPKIDVQIISRFGMSLVTAAFLHQRLTELLANIPAAVNQGTTSGEAK